MSINPTFGSSSTLATEQRRRLDQTSVTVPQTAKPVTAATPAAPEAATPEAVQGARTRALAGEEATRARVLGGDADVDGGTSPRRGLGGELLARAKPRPKPPTRPTGSTQTVQNNNSVPQLPGVPSEPQIA